MLSQSDVILKSMRYLVTARVKPGRERALAEAIEDGTLGAGSIAGGEYARCRKSGRTGKSISISSKFRTRTRDRAARISTATKPGPARTATAPTSWKRVSKRGDLCSWTLWNPTAKTQGRHASSGRRPCAPASATSSAQQSSGDTSNRMPVRAAADSSRSSSSSVSRGLITSSPRRHRRPSCHHPRQSHRHCPSCRYRSRRRSRPGL